MALNSLFCADVPLSNYSLTRLHSADTGSFFSELESSKLITNPPDSLDCLLTGYNSTLSSLLDKHAPIITKISNRNSKIPGFLILSALSALLFVTLNLSSNVLILFLTGENLNLPGIVTTILSLMPKTIFPQTGLSIIRHSSESLANCQ